MLDYRATRYVLECVVMNILQSQIKLRSVFYAIQNQTFSIQFFGICTGQTSASSAALPDQMSASEALTNFVRLKSFQAMKKKMKMKLGRYL